MHWRQLTDPAQLDDVQETSEQRPVLIFKHSTRCSLSIMIKERLEEEWHVDPDTVVVYYLDIIANRELSNEVVTTFNVPHQSPQVLLIKNGKSVFHTSHLAIRTDKLKEKAEV